MEDHRLPRPMFFGELKKTLDCLSEFAKDVHVRFEVIMRNTLYMYLSERSYMYTIFVETEYVEIKRNSKLNNDVCTLVSICLKINGLASL